MKPMFLLLVLLLSMLPLGAASFNIVDMDGRSVSISSPVRSVVSAGGTPAVNAFILALGGGNLIQNGLPDAINGKNWSRQLWFEPRLERLPVVSSGGPDWNVNVEALSVIPHDVVFVVNRISADALAQRGFSAVALTWQNPDSVKKTMELIGTILGRQNDAAEYGRYYDTTLDEISKRVTKHHNKPKALYLRYSNLSLPMVSTATWMIEHAGGINVAKGVKDHVQINAEQLLVWNPDYLFVWGKGEIDAIYKDKRFAELSAVKHRRVYVVPMGAHVWTHYTPEMPLAVVWAAGLFYPESFRDMPMNEVTGKFYQLFYRTKLTPLQITHILNP